MAVKITALESGRFLVTFDSMKKEMPDCTGYQLFIILYENHRANYVPVGSIIKERGGKEYSAKLTIPEEELPFLPNDKIVVKIVALKGKSGSELTKTYAEGVYVPQAHQ